MEELEGQGAAISYAQFNQDRNSLNQIRLDNEAEIHQLEQILRGNRYDWETRTWKTSGHALMNEKGIREIMILIRTHANRIFYLSNFSDFVAAEMVHNASTAIVDTLSFKCKEYDIDRRIRVVLERSLVNFVWAVILRAWMDKERIHIGTINKVVEQVIQERQTTQKKGFEAGVLRS